ncbi:GDPD and GPDPase memb domain containing protein [Trichuris trichiura]|uniref:GDPD and GPDPase memb domain containing protein n=1 Tax=Trichuris trichiura TaxID=36087 RepID=A0A077ZJQ8_TRITR|nr:GDPD and GPDPase memb domain containing protein [Trichuris trichiura]
MRHLRPETFFFFLFYFLLILPFANAIFRTPLLSKVTIPIFILEALSENFLFLLLLIVASIVVSYIGILRPSLWTRIAAVILFIFLGGTTLLSNVLYLTGLEDSIPLTISHRGVDNGNGVQNTIPAMAATIKEKPDYIEMDIQETKDRQFVVFHDKNLKRLTGRDKTTHELTLTFANEHHQKLLIEIKTTSADSKEMMDRFIDKYQATVLANHHRIHSLDYHVVAELKEKAPKLYVIFPQTPANAYTMEETTLTSDFVRRAHEANKDVYAWTVNDADSMDRMVSLNVNGIVTDDLQTLQEQIKTYEENPSYAKRIEMYINRLPALDERISEN